MKSYIPFGSTAEQKDTRSYLWEICGSLFPTNYFKPYIGVSWGSAVFADRYRGYRAYGDGILHVPVGESAFVGEVTELYLEEEYVYKEYAYRYYVVAVGTPYDGQEDESGYDTDECGIALIGRDVYEVESLKAQPNGYTSLKLTGRMISTGRRIKQNILIKIKRTSFIGSTGRRRIPGY